MFSYWIGLIFKGSESISMGTPKVDWFCGINDSYSRIKRYAIHGKQKLMYFKS